MFDSSDLLSAKLLAYFDFLVANSPYYNMVNSEVEDTMSGCASEHNRHDNLREMELLMKRLYCASVKNVILDDMDATPPKCCCALLADLKLTDRLSTI